ncbi:hypothetical protein BGX23_008780 [Mortierella sp. AD031]|nr:hypothetical protein BGX23_008780 [Mortierella sp. AD031]
MQVVAMSNHKLNSDIYSARSLSIHRRILVKNLLTLLYEMNPMLGWFDDAIGIDVSMYEPGGDEGEVSSEPLLAEEEQNGWIERTLSAAGLSEDDDDVENKAADKSRNNTPKTTKPKPTTTKQPSKSKEERGSPSPSSNGDKANHAPTGGSGVNGSSTPNLKKKSTRINLIGPVSPLFYFSITTRNQTGHNASDATTCTKPPPPTRSPIEDSGSISSVLPSFPPAPTTPAAFMKSPPPTSVASSSSPAPTAQVPPSPPRNYTLSPPSSSSSASFATSASSSNGSSTSSSSGSVPISAKAAPLPRPKSIELPQSLNNYLSAAFDVDWSVELPTMEDSLFTFGGGSSSSPTSSSLLGTSPPKASYLNGSLLSSSPKRRSYSSTTSTISSSSALSKASVTSSSSSRSSVDSWNKSPPLPATETAPSRGAEASSEIMVAKSVERPYQGISSTQQSNNTTSASRGVNGAMGSGVNSASKKNSTPTRQETPRTAGPANGTGPAPIKGGAVPRAGDSQSATKTTNNTNNNRLPATGTSAPKPVTRKTTLVPGRRSSLLHTGQMPSASAPRRSPTTSGPDFIGSNNNTTSTNGSNGIAVSSNNSANTAAIPYSASPPLPSINTPFANGYLSSNSNTAGFSQGQQQDRLKSGSGSGSVNIVRRASLLPPVERPAPVQRNHSSENVASSAGLPRPLLAKSYPSPIVLGSAGPSPSPLPSSPTSSTTGNGSGYEYHSDHGYNGVSSSKTRQQQPYLESGGFPVITSRSPPHAPQKLIMQPISPPSSPSSSTIFAPLTPPRSPSRASTALPPVASYVLTQAPVVSSFSSPPESGAPVLPPLFPMQNQDHSSGSPTSPSSPYSHRSPPTSPYSTTGAGPIQYQQQLQQKQYPTPPFVYTRSNSDDQVHTQSFSTRTPPPSSNTSSPPSTTTMISSQSTTIRPAASYVMKLSNSSPDLITGSSSLSEMLVQRPLPSLPAQYQSYSQNQQHHQQYHQQQPSYIYQPQLQHQNQSRYQQQAYSYQGYGDSLSRSASAKPVMSSAPIPRIAMSPPAGSSGSSGGGGGGGSNRWASMKSMFSLKTTTGHGGK